MEKQCDDLLEALEKEEVVEVVAEKPVKTKQQSNNEIVKCKKHDKGRCFFGPKCNFSHSSNTVCKTFSKLGFCNGEEECPDRHPTGVCLQWRRAICDKDLHCFYQHPQKEHGSLARGGNKKETEEGKRKRSSSSEPSPSKSAKTKTEISSPKVDPFLYDRMSKLEKELEFHRKNMNINPAQPQPMYMMAPAPGTPAPPVWSAMGPCPAPGGSNITTGPWGNIIHEQRMPGMTQFYQTNQ